MGYAPTPRVSVALPKSGHKKNHEKQEPDMGSKSSTMQTTPTKAQCPKPPNNHYCLLNRQTKALKYFSYLFSRFLRIKFTTPIRRYGAEGRDA